ncbi:MAG TPA: hypothetical protein VJX68_06405 [Candidatus Binatus sp.]|nr:hypothetical protein [Candidatus Binatus sp.]
MGDKSEFTTIDSGAEVKRQRLVKMTPRIAAVERNQTTPHRQAFYLTPYHRCSAWNSSLAALAEIPQVQKMKILIGSKNTEFRSKHQLLTCI